jgi:cyanophycinase-like exopeptidase
MPSDPGPRPLYLLADSQLLFWKTGTGLFLSKVLASSDNPRPNVAYFGASNGDSPEAYAIFTAAMEQVEVGDLRRVGSAPTEDDLKFVDTADVLLLAGNDPEAGWNVFTRTGLRERIETRYRAGAVLVGVSAGAVQFGSHVTVPGDSGASRLIETFGFVNLIVDAHDEKQDWRSLAGTIHLLEGAAIGLGIPHGGGLIAHPDGMLEPVRHAVEEFTYTDGKLRRSVLLPDLVT